MKTRLVLSAFAVAIAVAVAIAQTPATRPASQPATQPVSQPATRPAVNKEAVAAAETQLREMRFILTKIDMATINPNAGERATATLLRNGKPANMRSVFQKDSAEMDASDAKSGFTYGAFTFHDQNVQHAFQESQADKIRAQVKLVADLKAGKGPPPPATLPAPKDTAPHVGMTLAEAEKVTGGKAVLREETTEGKSYQIYGAAPDNRSSSPVYTLTVDTSGKIIAVIINYLPAPTAPRY